MSETDLVLVVQGSEHTRDAAQSFSFAEKLQGRTNIGAAAAADQTALTVAGNSSSTFNLSRPYPSLILYNYQSSAFAMALYQGN